jgi:hypothetical protein
MAKIKNLSSFANRPQTNKQMCLQICLTMKFPFLVGICKFQNSKPVVVDLLLDAKFLTKSASIFVQAKIS